MHHIILNIGKSVLIAIGLNIIFHNWAIAIIASIFVEGFLSTTIWFLSGVWYPIFEYFYTGEVSQYGWWVVGLSISVIIISLVESMFLNRSRF